MYIIPYFLTEPQKGSHFHIKTAWVFLKNGGATVWETDEAKCTEKFISENYLIPNGFHGKVTKRTKTSLFFQIDMAKTKIQDFYSWSDFLKKEETVPTHIDIFRPFFWVDSEDNKDDDWGWREECKSVCFGKFGTLEDLWEGLRSS